MMDRLRHPLCELEEKMSNMCVRVPSARVLVTLILLALFGVFASPVRSQDTATIDEDWTDAFQWRSIGPTTAGGRIVRIAVVESDPNTFYVASAGGGLWKTTNNGITFEGLFQHESTISIGDVVVSPSNPDIVWVGTGEHNPRNSVSWGDGVYKSTDGGKTWKNMGLKDSFQIGRMAIHPTNPDIVYVGALGRLWGPNRQRGVFKTTDGGETWRKVLFVSENTGIIELQMNPDDPDTLLAAAYQRRRDGFDGGEPAISSGPESGVYKTTDGGKKWTRLSKGLPEGDMGRTGIDYYQSDPDIVYLQTGGSRVRDGSNGVYRSEDGGDSWKKVNDLSIRPMYYSQIRVDPSDDQRVYTMATSSHRSTDGGKTFSSGFAGRPRTHEDSHELWIDPRDGAHMILGNDGGLFQTYDYGRNWDFIGNLPIAQSYHVGLSPQRRYWAYTGLQDNGNWGAPNLMRGTRGPGNDDWVRVSGADGFVCLVDPNDANTLYYETQNSNMRRMDLRTGRSSRIRPQAENQRWNWEGPLCISPHDSKVLFTVGKNVFRLSDRGDDADEISDDLSSAERGSGSAVAQSPINANVIYAGYTDGALWVTRDGGKEWKRIDTNVGLPGQRWVDSIEASRYEEGRVYVAFDGHRSNDDAPYAFVSEDYGATWRSMNDGLPENGSTRALREDITNPNLLYCGTEFAMFASIDRGRSWTKINNNLPTVAIHEVALHGKSGEIVVASHGRGLWVLDVTPLRQMTTRVHRRSAHLFQPQPAILWQRGGLPTGDLYGGRRWYGENPYRGAVIYYFLRQSVGSLVLTITDDEGNVIRTMTGDALGKDARSPGLHRIEWNTRRDPARRTTNERRSSRGGQQGNRGGSGSQVSTGTYRLTLTINGEQLTQSVQLQSDPGDG
ncbi:MAG: hypothetical protein MPJ50_05505 [Pirellulales bacterium]|nr:hypothetical protein [Pirellulales bacterium]